MTTPNTTLTPMQRVEREIDFQVSLYDKKYTYIRYKNGGQEALRYGEKWRDLTGDGFIYSLATELEVARNVETELRRINAGLCRQLADKTRVCEELKKDKERGIFGSWIFRGTDINGSRCIPRKWTCCPVCGTPRPATKKGKK